MNTKNITLVSLFAALTAIGAFLTIPTEPIPFTLQLLFCLLSGIILGGKLGGTSQIVYIIIGLIGIPVFSGGTGGLSSLVTPSFGFLLGFVLCSFVVGYLTQKLYIPFFKNNSSLKNIIILFAISFVGILLIYLIGLPYMYMIFNVYLGKEASVLTILAWGFFPYILPDMLKGLIVALLGNRLIPILKINKYI